MKLSPGPVWWGSDPVLKAIHWGQPFPSYIKLSWETLLSQTEKLMTELTLGEATVSGLPSKELVKHRQALRSEVYKKLCSYMNEVDDGLFAQQGALSVRASYQSKIDLMELRIKNWDNRDYKNYNELNKMRREHRELKEASAKDDNKRNEVTHVLFVNLLQMQTAAHVFRELDREETVWNKGAELHRSDMALLKDAEELGLRAFVAVENAWGVKL